jgi:CubicO group peptidase (beta-lactamase class C family)
MGMDMKAPFSIVLLLSVAGGGCLGDAPCDAAPADASAADRALAGALDDERRRLGVPGLSVAVVESGVTTHLVNLGRDRHEAEDCRPMTAATRSINPTISGLVKGLGFAAAVADGLFAASAPVTSVIEDFTLLPGAATAGEVQLQHLAADASGLPIGLWQYTMPCEGDALEVVLATTAAQGLWWRPGQLFSESETNWALTALAVQRASGQLYEDFVAARLFEPLAMSATYDEAAAQAGDWARGNPSAPYRRARCGPIRAGTGLYASVSDGARVAEMMTSGGGAVLSQELVAKQVDAGLPITGGEARHGWSLVSLPLDGDLLMAHYPSFGDGVAADFVLLPSATSLSSCSSTTTAPPRRTSRASRSARCSRSTPLRTTTRARSRSTPAPGSTRSAEAMARAPARCASRMIR